MKRVLLFGIYDPKYSRSRTLTKGFRANGWVVSECRVDPREHGGISKYIKLFHQGIKEKNKHDLVIVAFPGQTIVWLARLIFGPEIIFDAFVSMYDSNVFDRKVYSKYSIRGLRDYFFDWLSVKLCRYALLDTYDHIKYYSETFGLPCEKFKRVLVGTDISHTPTPKVKGDKFIVEFHGTYIPLQGIEFILQAAHELRDKQDIQFCMIGRGQTYKECMALADKLELKNVEFVDKVPFDVLVTYIEKADICLGIFGSTPKTKRVIPNKVYECAAMGKAVITADSIGIQEVFEDKKDVYLVEGENGKVIAKAILDLKENDELRKKLEVNAFKTHNTTCTPAILVKNLLKDLNMH